MVDKIAIVTGASSGIGLAIATAFKKSGAIVCAIDKNPCPRDFDLFYQGDISQSAVVEAFAGEVLSTYGRVDFLINNAMMSMGGILSQCSYEDFMYVQRVGVGAPYLLAKLFHKSFGRGASIVNISSTRAYSSQPDTESYSAAKGGISALTHSLAVSLREVARVNSISPGWIDTTDSVFRGSDCSQHPVNRVGTPQDIVDAVMFLCSPQSSFITGQNITVDGGMSAQMIYHNDLGWHKH